MREIVIKVIHFYVRSSFIFKSLCFKCIERLFLKYSSLAKILFVSRCYKTAYSVKYFSEINFILSSIYSVKKHLHAFLKVKILSSTAYLFNKSSFHKRCQRQLLQILISGCNRLVNFYGNIFEVLGSKTFSVFWN